MKRIVKRVLIAALVVPLVYILLVLAFVFAPDVSNFLARQPFDSERWKAWEVSEEEHRLRWTMVPDLTRKHELVGMSRERVIDLLGQPDQDHEPNMYYFLGLTGHGIDTGSLMLYMDDNDTVERYEVWHG